MLDGQASDTAATAAVMRAAHPAFDRQPWIFNDNFAGRLAGYANAEALNDAITGLRTQLGQAAPPALIDAWSQSTRLCPAVRSRYAEDSLDAAIARGVDQYVILGAGLDSFAFRRLDLEHSVKVYEVDYPASQEDKRERVRKINVATPSNLTYTPIDFEKQFIIDALADTGFKAEKPAFFSWLGVTFFLSDDAIDGTLSQIAKAAKGSEIVFDYILPKDVVDDNNKQVVDFIRSIAVADGDNAGHCFTPQNVEERLKRLGFSEVWHLSPDDVDQQYFKGRNDGLKASRVFQYVRARV